MRRPLRGRNLLITGASRGIGRCLAEQAIAQGARVALTARSADELEKLAGELTARGAVAVAVPGDLTVPEQRSRVVETAAERLGGLDVLVNNAGLGSFGHFDTSSEEVLRRIMEINFFVPAEMIRLAVPHLINGTQPAVVNVASVCGRRGIPSWPEHSASKFALVGLSEALRGEFVRFGIDVLTVLPGVVRSDDLDRHLLRNEGRIRINFESAQPPEQVAAGILRAIRHNRRETVIGFVAWWVVFGQRISPVFMNRLLAWKVWPRPKASQ